MVLCGKVNVAPYFSANQYRRLRLHIRKLSINVGLRLLEIRMVLRKASIICLQRGYYAPDEVNLLSNLWLVRAGINHPVKVIKVLLDCWHNWESDAKNEVLSNAKKVDGNQPISDALKPCQDQSKIGLIGVKSSTTHFPRCGISQSYQEREGL